MLSSWKYLEQFLAQRRHLVVAQEKKRERKKGRMEKVKKKKY